MRAAIASQVCPFCGKGPFSMLPVHTNKIHGVDKWELRDMAGLASTDPICAEESLALMRERGLARPPEHVQKATEAGRRQRKPYRWTKAGRQRVTDNILAWNETEDADRVRAVATAASKTPEARQRQADSLRENWQSREISAEARRSFAERMHHPDVVAKRAAARVLQGHGTVACYKRGCRCKDCRRAKAASR